MINSTPIQIDDSSWRLPGFIDIHVHFRDPGQTHKEDFYTGTSSALAGGVTTVFDMPNNSVPIFTKEKLSEKEKIAEEKAVCDWGLYFGTNGKNIEELKNISDNVVGLKLYLSSETHMAPQYSHVHINDKEVIKEIFQAWPNNKVIVLHADNEMIDMSIEFARMYGNKIHITHVNNKQVLEKVVDAKNDGLHITCDTTPHYLFLTKVVGEKLDGFGMVMPPLQSKEDCSFLWDHLDIIDCIATDHAPHTREEKMSENPPFGLPGVETMLPLLLNAVYEKKLTMDDIIRLTHTNPLNIFDIHPNEQTYTEVDLNTEYIIESKQLHSKSGWTPFEGWKVKGRVKTVYIRGTKAYENGKVLVEKGFGKNVRPA